MASYTGTNTSNFNLDKIDRIEQELGNAVKTLRDLQNNNMDKLDGALQTISESASENATSLSAGLFNYVSVSSDYSAGGTDYFIDNGAAVTITVADGPAIGKQYLISRANTVSVIGRGCTVNGATSVSAVQYSRLTAVTTFSPADTNVNGVLTVVKTGAATWRLY